MRPMTSPLDLLHMSNKMKHSEAPAEGVLLPALGIFSFLKGLRQRIRARRLSAGGDAILTHAHLHPQRSKRIAYRATILAHDGTTGSFVVFIDGSAPNERLWELAGAAISTQHSVEGFRLKAVTLVHPEVGREMRLMKLMEGVAWRRACEEAARDA